MEVNACYMSNTGKVRRHNEDSLLLNGLLVAGADMEGPECSEADSARLLYLVADGMGGHMKGEVASKKALETFQGHHELAEGIEGLRKIMGLAKQELNLFAKENRDSFGLGTTVSGICFTGGRAIVINCGDSRVYRLRGRSLVRLTRDDSLVQELLESGAITEDGMRTHPGKNIVTAALVGDLSETPPGGAFREYDFESGQIFLVCSDGLWESMSREEMEGCFSGGDLSQTAGCLFTKAMERGGRDNISLIVLEVRGTVPQP